MPIMLLKSMLSFVLLASGIVQLITMLKIQAGGGGVDKSKLKRIHRLNGFFFIALLSTLGVMCLTFAERTGSEMNIRVTIHAVLSFAIFSVLFIKLLILKKFRSMYKRAITLGFLAFVLTVSNVGISGIYYILAGPPVRSGPPVSATLGGTYELSADPDVIAYGLELYESKCYMCHDPDSYDVITGPGHKRILKNPELPISGKPASPENIVNQLMRPYGMMPTFSYLASDEINALLAYMNTL